MKHANKQELPKNIEALGSCGCASLT